MREIKFRAWDKTTKTMYDVRELEWAGGEILTAYIGLHTSDADNIQLMQYTGLKDKNGKEIYEGDVIRLIPEKVDVVVEWDIRQVGFVMRETKNIGRYHADLGGYTRDAFEIIGNIYENPELLK